MDMGLAILLMSSYGTRTGGRWVDKEAWEGNQVKLPPWLADVNVEIHKIYQQCSVEADLHGGTNRDPSEQMCVTDRLRLRTGR